MKTAKEMFEELGWACFENFFADDSQSLLVYMKKNTSICFGLKYKTYYAYTSFQGNKFPYHINQKTHKAIHQQMKELKWL